MRSKVAERMLKNIPKDVDIFVEKYANLVVLINHLLAEKGYNQKTLAEKLDKNPSEINKWLSGEHNFTLRSIAKLEAELGETLLEVPIHRHNIPYLAQPKGEACFSVVKSSKIAVYNTTDTLTIHSPEESVNYG